MQQRYTIVMRESLRKEKNKMSMSPKKRIAVYRRDNFKCVFCGATEDLTIDHKIPRSKGGTNAFDNLQTACVKCNTEKGNYHETWWRKLLVFLTRKESNIMKNDLICAMGAKDGALKVSIQRELKADLDNRFNQATPKLTEVMKAIVAEYKINTDKKDERLLYLFNLLAERVELIENYLEEND